MSGDAHCPECGEPISATAAYCMHCYADLPEGPVTGGGGASEDRGWGDQETPDPTNENFEDPTTEAHTTPIGQPSETPAGTAGGGAGGTGGGGGGSGGGGGGTAQAGTGSTADDQLLDPDGIVDNTLTVIVGIVGGIVVGIASMFLLTFMTESAWGLPIGFVTWLAATAYLSRRRTVQGAIAHTGYAIAIVMLAFPFLGFSPAIQASGMGDRISFFVGSIFVVAFPAVFFAGIGFVASRFTPDSGSGA